MTSRLQKHGKNALNILKEWKSLVVDHRGKSVCPVRLLTDKRRGRNLVNCVGSGGYSRGLRPADVAAEYLARMIAYNWGMLTSGAEYELELDLEESQDQ